MGHLSKGGDDTSMSALAVACGKPSDALAIEALLDAAAAWQQSRGIRQWRPGQFGEEVHQTIANGDLYVARRAGVIVGCFMLDTLSPSWMARWLVEQGRVPSQGAHVGRLAVARDATGRALGLELLNVGCAIAAQRGRAYVRLDCPAENARLRRCYFEAGFRIAGT